MSPRAPRQRLPAPPLSRRPPLDDLVEWVEQTVPNLRSYGVPRDRRRHIQRMFEILDFGGSEEQLTRDWLNLARKIARYVEVDPPEGLATKKLLRRAPRQPRSEGDSRPAPKQAKRPRARAGGEPKRRRARLPERPPIEMNAQLERAFTAVANRKPILFVTGGAGTGKSTFIHELRARFHDRNSAVLAPTGVAALNAGGQTIHSFCKLPLRIVTPEDIREVEEPEVVRNLDLLIVDEVSMVRADILDGVERFLRINRKSQEPFGGVQIVLVGDLFQLPPVVRSDDAPLIRQRYESPFFFSAHALRGLSFTPVELEIVYRQKDPEFAQMLRALREGERFDRELEAINRACVGRPLTGQYLTLVPTRRRAAEENEKRLAALRGESKRYEAVIEGTFPVGSEDRLPAPQNLTLKRGAQVMFVRNHPEKLWVNGTIGTVDRIGTDSIRVALDDGSRIEVEPVEWENVRYGWDEKEKKIVDEVLGTFRQFPLMPAWAVTIHKAQGLTLDRVAIDLASGAFAEGQIYVALSRCRSLEGLSLARPVRAGEVRASEASRGFYAKIRGRRATRGAEADGGRG